MLCLDGVYNNFPAIFSDLETELQFKFHSILQILILFGQDISKTLLEQSQGNHKSRSIKRERPNYKAFKFYHSSKVPSCRVSGGCQVKA